MEGNRQYRRWLSKQPQEYQKEVQDAHRLIIKTKRIRDIEKALDGISARIVKDEDATEALMYLYNMQ